MNDSFHEAERSLQSYGFAVLDLAAASKFAGAGERRDRAEDSPQGLQSVS